MKNKTKRNKKRSQTKKTKLTPLPSFFLPLPRTLSKSLFMPLSPSLLERTPSSHNQNFILLLMKLWRVIMIILTLLCMRLMEDIILLLRCLCIIRLGLWGLGRFLFFLLSLFILLFSFVFFCYSLFCFIKVTHYSNISLRKFPWVLPFSTNGLTPFPFTPPPPPFQVFAKPRGKEKMIIVLLVLSLKHTLPKTINSPFFFLSWEQKMRKNKEM